MRLKRYGNSLGSARPSPGNDLAQYVRMRAMHSVKVADADQRRAEVGGNVFEFVENLHRNDKRRRTSDLGLWTSDLRLWLQAVDFAGSGRSCGRLKSEVPS